MPETGEMKFEVPPLREGDSYWTVTMVCFNIAARSEEDAFETAYSQITDDSADLVTAGVQTVVWRPEYLPG